MREAKGKSSARSDEVVGGGRHSTVRIEYGDEQADVDKKIAPLVLEMWKAGIPTYMSCQGNPEGWVWLVFESTADVERFLQIIGPYDPREVSLHDRMLYGYDRRGDFQVHGQWRYETLVVDISEAALGLADEDEREESYCPYDPLFHVTIALHFPVSDLRAVLRRLRAYNASP